MTKVKKTNNGFCDPPNPCQDYDPSTGGRIATGSWRLPVLFDGGKMRGQSNERRVVRVALADANT
jgi:hypothetical protein